MTHSNETKHTPTPWVADFNNGQSAAKILSPMQGEHFTYQTVVATTGGLADECKANATFIVRACNAHDELVAFVNLVAAGHLTHSGFVDAAKEVQRRLNATVGA
jgi:hypothetical protein